METRRDQTVILKLTAEELQTACRVRDTLGMSLQDAILFGLDCVDQYGHILRDARGVADPSITQQVAV